MKKLKVTKVIAIGLCCVTLLGITALAGTKFEFYDTTVGKVNGNGYTGFQTKVTTGAAADLYSYIVGGNYEVDVRQIDTKGNNGSWCRNVVDDQDRFVDGHSGHTAGSSVRLQFSNNLTTVVDIQVQGQWASN